MRRVAANKVYFSPTIAYLRHIVEIFGKTVVNHYELADELELTEWLGGIIIIADENSITQFVDDIHQATFTPTHIDEVVNYIYNTVRPAITSEKSSSRKTALHLSGVDISTGKILDKIHITHINEPII
ncbi:MAG: hypothetical protein IKH26_10970 [Bacteroidaceae bacterium]|nr:hypothetical protein [Bacteroidaceae bacterium]